MASEKSYNLQEKIAEYKTKHFKEDKPPEKVTQEMTADLLAMQQEAIKNAVDTADLEALADELFGKDDETPPKKEGKQADNSNEDLDIKNRAARELEGCPSPEPSQGA
jgi:hypothetical protein